MMSMESQGQHLEWVYERSIVTARHDLVLTLVESKFTVTGGRLDERCQQAAGCYLSVRKRVIGEQSLNAQLASHVAAVLAFGKG